ncbi:Putative uncharacterized protein [Taphrina deformans PYCC 5710]|uniref:Pet127-domain-containing protein n=1 Tax=Taphrina deformans (strain PYCC 5710 / ATCC 11124 / CBS 356.35 / IMI 108563 / JCM 9778 / NBRC 8474) TaxID=1097556 RepID=R4X717_TAPDE|nr:Putative uncharacterized protein [Taphrina deformans PYCC 5710]|eukprot:CCG81042.1 Putative uncharacterized protein [Taphrina deformans PYCC 5710]
MRERTAIARTKPSTSVVKPISPAPRKKRINRPLGKLQEEILGSQHPINFEQITTSTTMSVATDEIASETNEPKEKRPRKRRSVTSKSERVKRKKEAAVQARVPDLNPEAPSTAFGSTPSTDVVEIEPPEKVAVPRLAHGLDRVLFNPGVYYLQDPRSHVYNFDPYLQVITPVKDFNFDALTQYITSSRDTTLDELARTHGLQVVGSTSSMTGVLSQFHYFVSHWRPVNLRRLSSVFVKKSKQFTASQRAPASIYLRHNDGVYAIDADKSLDSGETVLSFLGRSMEKMLTLEPDEFAKLKKVNSRDAPKEQSREAYHYSKIGRILMRSQLDCQDSRLPGTGTFDLKTRAVLPVRMDVKNAHEGAGYQILQSTGLLESFEREYYDMIRAAFLKYSLQVRIGQMEGIFVAYHNTERIFGFQFISLEEMDDCIHGSSDQNIAQREYLMSLKQLDKILELAIDRYPRQSMALSFETLEEKKGQMRIVIEPLTEDEIKSRQQGELLEALRAAQQNERIKKMPSSAKSTNSKGTLETMSNTLEQMIMSKKQKDKSGSSKKKAKEQSAALEDDAPGEDELGDKERDPETESRPKVMFTLQGTNVINGKVVEGPPQPAAGSTWQFKFKVKESTDVMEINRVMGQMRGRQAQAWTDIYEDTERPDSFRHDLKRISDLGRIKLQEIKTRQSPTPVVYRESSSKDLEQEYRRNFQQPNA